MRNARSGKETSIANPMFFFGDERSLVGEAVAGDVIGIPNHGTLNIGDTLTEKSLTRVSGIRDFAPEIIRRILLKDISKAKQLAKGLADMAAEGAGALATGAGDAAVGIASDVAIGTVTPP